MRRTITLAATVLLAGCATAPQPQATEPRQPALQSPPPESGSLVGLGPQELVARFGNPALQIREGSSVKLQFRGHRCVLDAYLYPSGSSGALKVAHVDTRLRSGGDIDQAACIFSLRNAG